MTPLEFAQRHIVHFRVKGKQIQATYCPYCRGGEHCDKHTFAMSAENGAYNCKRGKCSVAGTFTKLLLDFGERGINMEYRKQPEKKFKPSKAQVSQVNDSAAQYLKLRGISPETVKALKIGTDGKGNIVFPFFKNGKQVAVKYRPARKLKPSELKMWREEGTDTTALFGIMDDAKDETLVITEGEFDCAAVYEASKRNVVSVPNGCQDFGWIEANWEVLEKYKKIILCGDNDEAGHEMIEKLIPKLGEYRCSVVQIPETCKDANEVLVKHGKFFLNAIIKEAKEVNLSGILRLADVPTLDLSKIAKVTSGFSSLDKAIGGFMMGQVSVWTGVNSSGKSTLLGQLLLEAINNDFSVCAFSGELPAPLFRYWIELQAAGKANLEYRHDKSTESDDPYVPTETSQTIRDWYRDKFFLYDNTGAINVDAVMKVFEYAARRYNCKVFFADNLMMLVTGNEDYYRNQSDFVKAAASFCKKFDCHMHIVAHPRKAEGRLTKMDIAGSGDITNLADNVFSLHRITDEEREEKKLAKFADCSALLDVFKNRFRGRQEMTIGLKFENSSKRFYQATDEAMLIKNYKWHKGGLGNGWMPYAEQEVLPF